MDVLLWVDAYSLGFSSTVTQNPFLKLLRQPGTQQLTGFVIFVEMVTLVSR